MNQPIRIALIVVLLGSAGAIYFMSGGKTNDLATRTDYNAVLHCLACDSDFQTRLEVTDRPPIQCTKCGEASGWPKWECNNCGEMFTPEPFGDPPQQPVVPACPKCGKTSTGRMAGEY